jgi:hypothetical protein
VIDYAQRLASLLLRQIEAAGVNKESLDDIIDFVDEWKPDSSELTEDGATGAELKYLWDQWPPGADYCIDECFEIENENGDWMLVDERYYTEQEIEDLGGYIMWQGDHDGPPKDGWHGASFADIWRQFRKEEDADRSED